MHNSPSTLVTLLQFSTVEQLPRAQKKPRIAGGSAFQTQRSCVAPGRCSPPWPLDSVLAISTVAANVLLPDGDMRFN